jgi:hypothetical protein
MMDGFPPGIDVKAGYKIIIKFFLIQSKPGNFLFGLPFPH